MLSRKRRTPGALRAQKLRVLRRALVLPYAIAGIVLLPLALIRGCDTRVAVDVTAREFAFDLAGHSMLVDAARFDELYVARGGHGTLETDGRVLRLRAGPDGSFAIAEPRLSALQTKPGAHVLLTRNDAGSVGVSVTESSATVQLTAAAPGRFECEYCEIDGTPHEHFRGSFDGTIGMKLAGDRGLHLVLTTAEGSILAENIPIAGPSFVGGWEEPVSSLIAAGKVSLPEIEGDAIPVRPGDMLSFEEPHHFRIDSLEATPRGLRVQMTGWTRGVSTGGANRLPSVLQRLHAKQALALYTALVVLVAGTAVNALRQLHVIEPLK